jgi:histidinol dehydrogenase
MIPLLQLPDDAARVEQVLGRLRLDPADLALSRGPLAKAEESVRQILAAVAQRGDDAIVEYSRRFDDPQFTAQQIRVSQDEIRRAADRVSDEQLDAIRQSIAQVRQYQQHIMPVDPAPLRRDGAELGLRFTPLDSAALYFPAGKAAYPSSLIMLAVPAQVAGVQELVAVTAPSYFGKSDLVLAAACELGIQTVLRGSGVAMIAALAFGTASVKRVDKIVGPGNTYVQLAKRMLFGGVGIDGFLGPSEIVTLADDTANARFIAADLLAQAEHDPGNAFLLTSSPGLVQRVLAELQRQLPALRRTDAIKKALAQNSAIVVDSSMDRLVELANRFAAEHVNIQTADDEAVLAKLRHGGAVFVGPWSAVAAGDYVAGPSHCLPTGTTARFTSGVSVYEFLKRSSIERYTCDALDAEAHAIMTLAKAEGLDAHAASVAIRLEESPEH